MCLVIKMTHTITNCQTAFLKSHDMSITLACWQNQVQVYQEDFFFSLCSFFPDTNCFYSTKQPEASLDKLLHNLKLLYIGCIRSCDIAFVPKNQKPSCPLTKRVYRSAAT